MFQYLETLFGAAQFVPHAVCLLWRPDLLFMHGASDLLIGIAYLTIPFVILKAMRRRPDLVDVGVARLFVAFISACALSHLAGLLTLWVPAYGLQGVIKILTAGISLYTAVQLARRLPVFLTLPSREEMARQVDAMVRSERRAELAEEAQEKLGEFASIASHDLKAPIRGLANHVRFLIEDHGPSLDPDARQRLDRMSTLCEHMDELITTLLRYSRIGRIEAEVEVDAEETVRAISESLDELLTEKNGVIEIETPLPKLRANPADVDTVLRNLILNGLTYNDAETRVVTVGFAQETVANGERLRDVYYVRDNGIGIDPEVHEDVFRMFKRLNQPEAYGGGSGVGLAFVKKIVEASQGAIRLTSETGAGSAFYVSFTRQAASDDEPRAAEQPTSAGARAEGAIGGAQHA